MKDCRWFGADYLLLFGVVFLTYEMRFRSYI